MHIWMGECHVHAGIDPADVGATYTRYPDAELLVHPECGCTAKTLYDISTGALPADRTHILSTEGMVRHAQASPNQTFIVATETGILHKLRNKSPDKTFVPASRAAECHFMKRITLPKPR
jgi:quinolinate synthase